jgi:hypothetical protein
VLHGKANGLSAGVESAITESAAAAYSFAFLAVEFSRGIIVEVGHTDCLQASADTTPKHVLLALYPCLGEMLENGIEP